jgi:hypothetical protein
VDPFAVEVNNGEVATVACAVGDALGDAPEKAGPCCNAPGTRPGRNAGGARRGSHAVEDLSAQSTDKALAGCIHARRLEGGAHDPGASGLEDGVEG